MKQKTLLQIVKSNVSGVLKGVCRPIGKKGLLDCYFGNSRSVKISFSLRRKPLGTYTCTFQNFQSHKTGGIITSQMLFGSIRYKGKDSMTIVIFFEGDGTEGKFAAQLVE